MNFFKLYIGDYLRDTGTLSIRQHGVYILMLKNFYATEKPLPTGRELYRLLRAENKADRDDIDLISSIFWIKTDAGLINKRALKEIAKSDSQRKINQELGKKGGRPKKTELITESVSISKPNDNPNQTPDTRHHKKIKEKALSRKTRLPDNFTISDRVKNWAAGKGLNNLQVHFDYFIGYAKAKGTTYVDWDQALMNAIRDNWAKVRDKHETHQRIDNSAVARVHRATAAIIDGESNCKVMAVDDGNVRPPLDIKLR